MGEKDTVILKVISPSSMQESEGLIREARKKARLASLKRSDIVAAIAEARKREWVHSGHEGLCLRDLLHRPSLSDPESLV